MLEGVLHLSRRGVAAELSQKNCVTGTNIITLLIPFFKRRNSSSSDGMMCLSRYRVCSLPCFRPWWSLVVSSWHAIWCHLISFDGFGPFRVLGGRTGTTTWLTAWRRTCGSPPTRYRNTNGISSLMPSPVRHYESSAMYYFNTLRAVISNTYITFLRAVLRWGIQWGDSWQHISDTRECLPSLSTRLWLSVWFGLVWLLDLVWFGLF